MLEWLSGDQKFCVLELPTGVGKSAIAQALGSMLAAEAKSTYVITSQKILQDQYVRDFATPDIRSSSEFRCSNVATSCGDASRAFAAMKKFNQCPACPYKAAKSRFVSSRVGVTNYSYLLSESTYAKELTPRDLLILDEGHNVEKEVRSWATVSMSEEWVSKELKLRFPPRSCTDHTLIEWFRHEYEPALASMKRDLEHEVGNASGKGVVSLARKLSAVDRMLGNAQRIFDSSDVSVLWTRTGADLRPVTVDELAHEALYSMGKKVLLMSATILDRTEFGRSCAIPDDAPYLTLPSPFRKEAYGVKFYPVAKVTRAGLDDEGRAKLVRAVKAVLRDNPTSKGIIHTGNYDLTMHLRKELSGDPRMLWQDSSADRTRIIREHSDSPLPTVLVSPGMSEGIDLRDDLSRFQVIMKVPWPSLGDPIVKRMSNERPRWYAWMAARTLVQSAGRSVRSQDDWARTYILDSTYGSFVKQWGGMLPDWIKP